MGKKRRYEKLQVVMVRVIWPCPWKISNKMQIFKITLSHYLWEALFLLCFICFDCKLALPRLHIKLWQFSCQNQPPKGAPELPRSWRTSCVLSQTAGRPEQAPGIPTAGSHRNEPKTSGLEMQLQPGPYLDHIPGHATHRLTGALAKSATPSVLCVLSSGELGPQHRKCLVWGNTPLKISRSEFIMCKSVCTLNNETRGLQRGTVENFADHPNWLKYYSYKLWGT